MQDLAPHPGNGVVGTGDGKEAEGAQDGHVGMARDPVGLGHDGIHRAQAVHRALEAGQKIEHHP